MRNTAIYEAKLIQLKASRCVYNQILTLLAWQLIEQRDLKNERWVSEEKASPQKKSLTRVAGPVEAWPLSQSLREATSLLLSVCCPPQACFPPWEASSSCRPWSQTLQRLDRLPGLSGAQGPGRHWLRTHLSVVSGHGALLPCRLKIHL